MNPGRRFIWQALCLSLLAAACKPEAVGPGEAFLKLYGGGLDQRVSDLAVLPDGGFVLLGSIRLPAPSGNAAWGMYLIRTDATGNEQWSTTLRETNWNLFGVSLALTADGAFALAGKAESANGLTEAPFFALVSPDGVLRQSGFPEANPVAGHQERPADLIRVDGPGPLRFALCGSTSRVSTLDGSVGDNDPSDFFILGLDEQGSLLWRTVYGRSGPDEAVSCALAPGGGLVIAGHSKETSAAAFSPLILEINRQGVIRDGRLLSSNSDEQARRLLLRPDGAGYVLAGIRNGNQPFLYALDLNWRRTLTEDTEAWANGAETVALSAAPGGFLALSGSALPTPDANRQNWRLLATDPEAKRLGTVTDLLGGESFRPHTPIKAVATPGGFAICGIFDFDNTNMICLALTDGSGQLRGAR